MKNKIVSLRVRNFKCFNNERFYKFEIEEDKNPIILSGPNGYGKTTFFDALEIIFSRTITRFDQNIESNNTNLRRNILLNNTSDDGYLVLTLKDEEHNYNTLICKISKMECSINFSTSLSYCVVDHEMDDFELEIFIEENDKWAPQLESDLNYIKDGYNIYYYVSQAESIHFLKKSMAHRGDVFNTFLHTENIQAKIETITKIIGANANSKNTLFYKDIEYIQNQIIKVIGELKKMNNEIQFDSANCEFVDLSLYDIDNKIFHWDSHNIEENSVQYINASIRELEGIIEYIDNISDYKIYLRNNRLNDICSENVIEDVLHFHTYFTSYGLDDIRIEQFKKDTSRKIGIFKCSRFFFMEDMKSKGIDENDLKELLDFLPELRNIDFDMIRSLTDELVNMNSIISTKNQLLKKVDEARKLLHSKVADAADDIFSSVCPYCNTRHESKEKLELGFEEMSIIIDKSYDNLTKSLSDKTDDLNALIDHVRKIIISSIGEMTDEEIKNLSRELRELNTFQKDPVRFKKALELHDLLHKNGFAFYDNLLEYEIAVNKLCSERILSYSNPSFIELNKKYVFSDVEKRYQNFWGKVENLEDLDMLKKKIQYLDYLISKKNNLYRQTKINELKGLIRKKQRIINAEEKLKELKAIYSSTVKEYKKEILSKLRVPLLIYSAKILQDYQAGLGVFVSDDNMRFVSSGDAKHDILNTFSSGQLSAFVLSFLFALNKQYVDPEKDDLGFILIDDPVQTMDDINVSSFIEVLKNDFGDKQIILSTHEKDKENYILYKFYKYNYVGQSFNVKEKLYT